MIAERITALIVGGGAVATRKVRSLREAGAAIRIIAPDVTTELANLAASSANVAVMRREYFGSGDIGDANIVIAATDSVSVNSRVAADALSLHRLVSVVNAPEKGNFTSMAVHSAGQLSVGVSAGNVPGAAARIRDAVAERFDERYAAALARCSAMRAGMPSTNSRDEWKRQSEILLGPDFCARVESGAFEEVTR